MTLKHIKCSPYVHVQHTFEISHLASAQPPFPAVCRGILLREGSIKLVR
jgi:hypothetical protein